MNWDTESADYIHEITKLKHFLKASREDSREVRAAALRVLVAHPACSCQYCLALQRCIYPTAFVKQQLDAPVETE